MEAQKQTKTMSEYIAELNKMSRSKIDETDVVKRGEFYVSICKQGYEAARTKYRMSTPLNVEHIVKEVMDGNFTKEKCAALWIEDKIAKREENKKNEKRHKNKPVETQTKQMCIDFNETKENAAETKKTAQSYEIKLKYGIGDWVRYGQNTFCVVDFTYKYSAKEVHYIINKGEKYYSAKACDLTPTENPKEMYNKLVNQAAAINAQINQMKQLYNF